MVNMIVVFGFGAIPSNAVWKAVRAMLTWLIPAAGSLVLTLRFGATLGEKVVLLCPTTTSTGEAPSRSRLAWR